MIGTADILPAQPFQLCPEKFLFMQVLAAFILVLFPFSGELPLDLHRQQTCKNSIPGILRGRRQDAVEHVLLHDPEDLGKHRLDGFPLIVSEIIDQ